MWSECKENDRDIIETIVRLGKYLLNLQQVYAQQDVYIVLSMPFNTISMKCIFINTSRIDDQTFLLKKPRDLEHEQND